MVTAGDTPFDWSEEREDERERECEEKCPRNRNQSRERERERERERASHKAIRLNVSRARCAIYFRSLFVVYQFLSLSLSRSFSFFCDALIDGRLILPFKVRCRYLFSFHLSKESIAASFCTVCSLIHLPNVCSLAIIIELPMTDLQINQQRLILFKIQFRF